MGHLYYFKDRVLLCEKLGHNEFEVLNGAWSFAIEDGQIIVNDNSREHGKNLGKVEPPTVYTVDEFYKQYPDFGY